MKTTKLFTVCILLTLACSSFIEMRTNEVNPFTLQDTSSYKVKEIYFQNGKLELMEIMVLETNIKLIWHENGQLKSRSQFYKGMPIGTFTQWYENGQKMSEGAYSKYDDTTGTKWKAVTEIEGFDKSINIVTKDQDIMSRTSISYKYPRTGQWQYWYDNGKLKQISNYKTYKASEINPIEIKEGKWQFYSPQGVLLKEVYYIADNLSR